MYKIKIKNNYKLHKNLKNIQLSNLVYKKN